MKSVIWKWDFSLGIWHRILNYAQMLTVSLHGIKLYAPYGLYPEENILGNDFEIDVDIFLPTFNDRPLPFVDYTLIHF
jgi:hypothetical protein